MILFSFFVIHLFRVRVWGWDSVAEHSSFSPFFFPCLLRTQHTLSYMHVHIYMYAYTRIYTHTTVMPASPLMTSSHRCVGSRKKTGESSNDHTPSTIILHLAQFCQSAYGGTLTCLRRHSCKKNCAPPSARFEKTLRLRVHCCHVFWQPPTPTYFL